MIRAKTALATAIALFTTHAALAQQPPAARPVEPVPNGFTLTIYSSADPATFDPKELARQRQMNPYNRFQLRLPGYGVVREVRPLELKGGVNDIKFTDVAEGIDPTTVAFESLTDPAGTAVLEQNYEYDVVSADKLLDKYLGRKIVVRQKRENEPNPSTINGTLLSYDGATLVLRTDSKSEPVRILQRNPDILSIGLAEAGTLITEPTLVWKVDANQAGKHDARVTYQTDGMTWRADYNVVVNQNDTAADVAAWVSILNESGANYPDARLKLVAGDVQRIQPQQNPYAAQNQMREMGKSMGGTGFQEKSFFEYHLYTLGRSTTLPNNSTKQIELFPTRNDVPVTKTFVYYGLPESVRYWISPEPNQDRNLGTQSNKKVDIYLQIKNTEANGLGIPLPAGRLRVYKQDDADGTNEFIGEDVITHTPKDEQVLVKLGQAFDIVGERKQTDFKADYNARWITEDFEITLRNHKKEPVTVIVRENLFRWVNWEITASSDKWEKQDYRTIHVPVQVPEGGEKKVTYSVKYTW